MENLDSNLLDALVHFKDLHSVPSQDEFIEFMTSNTQEKVTEDDADKIAEFYHMHFE